MQRHTVWSWWVFGVHGLFLIYGDGLAGGSYTVFRPRCLDYTISEVRFAEMNAGLVTTPLNTCHFLFRAIAGLPFQINRYSTKRKKP